MYVMGFYVQRFQMFLPFVLGTPIVLRQDKTAISDYFSTKVLETKCPAMKCGSFVRYRLG